MGYRAGLNQRIFGRRVHMIGSSYMRVTTL